MFFAPARGASAAGAPRKPPAGEDDESLFDQVTDILTPQGDRIVQFLWDRTHSTSYDRLAENCWKDGSAEDETIYKALKRVANDLNANLNLGVTIEIYHAKRRVKLIRPPDK